MTDSTSPSTGPTGARDLEFDFLAKAAYSPEGTFEDKDHLWARALGLGVVYAIARGELPDVSPYIASNAGVASGQPLLKVFTDTERLHDFAEANGLLDPDGGVSALALPLAGLLRAAHDYARSGIYGIHFNADEASYGFFTPFEQLPYIQEHLDGLKTRAAEPERVVAVDAPVQQAPVVVKIRRRRPPGPSGGV